MLNHHPPSDHYPRALITNGQLVYLLNTEHELNCSSAILIEDSDHAHSFFVYAFRMTVMSRRCSGCYALMKAAQLTLQKIIPSFCLWSADASGKSGR